MKTQIEKVVTTTRIANEARAWAESVLDGNWYYIEFSMTGTFVVCFNGLRNDPGPIRTLAALRWS